jgi:arginyl-tRNA synthetase
MEPEAFLNPAEKTHPAPNSTAQGWGTPEVLDQFAKYFAEESGNEIWELWLTAAKTSYAIEQCVATTEPAYAAKHAFQLAQLFNNFYHRHHILNEPDEGRKRFLMATAAVVRRELIRVLAVMGIDAPAVM